VKHGERWAFDAAAGREEILNRRVGRNELDVIQTLLAIVDAEREYAASDPDANGLPDYAKRINSAPGKKDGLYWPTKENEPESPLGPRSRRLLGRATRRKARPSRLRTTATTSACSPRRERTRGAELSTTS
jgi:hypothetical protein